jgi:uncharacterized membrane protein
VNDDPRGTNTGLRLIDLASITVVAAVLGAALLVWQGAPAGPMPMHFNAAGEVDRWGDRNEMAMVIAMMSILTAGMAGLFIVRERRARDPAERFTYRLGRVIGLVAPGMSALLLTLVAFGRLDGAGAGPRLVLGGVSLLFLGIGAFLGRAKPNPLVGVRTYWSLRSRLSWDKSNRLAGRLFSLAGIAGLIAAAAAPRPIAAAIVTAGTIVAAVVPIFESWRVWRTDPART